MSKQVEKPILERRFFARGDISSAIETRKAELDSATSVLPEPVTLRAAEDGQPTQIVGYSAVFGVDTIVRDWFGTFRERIKKGAFRRALREAQDVRALRNHDSDNVLGRTASKTLRLKEDDIGLHIEVDIPNTTVGRDTAELIKRGDISGMSFAFVVIAERWIAGQEGQPDLRIIEDVDLYDVGPVTFPAYPTTTADVRDASKIHQRGLAELGKPIPELPEEDPNAGIPTVTQAEPGIPAEESTTETQPELPAEASAESSGVEEKSDETPVQNTAEAKLRLIKLRLAQNQLKLIDRKAA